jgi:hypothetical protein
MGRARSCRAQLQLGFQVTVLNDADYRSMDVALKRNVRELRGAGSGAIGFAMTKAASRIASAVARSRAVVTITVLQAARLAQKHPVKIQFLQLFQILMVVLTSGIKYHIRLAAPQSSIIIHQLMDPRNESCTASPPVFTARTWPPSSAVRQASMAAIALRLPYA